MLGSAVVWIAVGMFAVAGSPAGAVTDPAATCKEAKAKATGKKAAAILKAFGKNFKKENASGLGQDISKAESKFTKAFAKAEGRGGCHATGDAGTIEAEVNGFAAEVISLVCCGAGTTTTSVTTVTSTTTEASSTTAIPTTTTTAASTTTTVPGDLPRDWEPIVVTGADLPALSGETPEDVFVFRFDTGAGWQQIPHQVDERQMTKLWGTALCPTGCELRYVFSGSEGNGLDGDDEVVFMGADVGEMASGSEPAGVSGPGYEVAVNVPGEGTVGYAYIFVSPVLGKDFGAPLVGYTRSQIDPDTEDTDIVTQQYRLHFSRLWVIDAIEVLPGGGGDGVDLLDRWKGRAYSRSLSGETEDIVGKCGGWSNHDPDWGVHTYLGHINGPVRAIRSIQGACSWPHLTRVDVFYRGMAKMILNIRGHRFAPGAGGLWAYWDYEEAASPMTYYNPMVPEGTVIDGSNDPAYPNGDNGPEVAQGWEQIDSAHGGIVSVVRETIDVPGPIKAFIWDDVGYDDGTGEDPQGDPGVIGGNGYHILYIDNTDPASGGTPAQVVFHYWPLPGSSGAVGESYAAAVMNPSTISVAPY